MNPNIKKVWVEGLRSGKYKQVKGALKANEDGITTKYCCLGVLCDIVDPEARYWNYMDHGYPPEEIKILAGFIRSSGDVPGCTDRDGGSLTLAVLNDAGFTFNQIADVIEYFL